MKRCPECRRDYYDDTLGFCLEDGTPLVQGSVPVNQAASDEPATAILHATDAAREAPTRAQIHTTEKTAVLPSGIADVPQKGFDKRLIAAPILVAVIALGVYLGYRSFSPTTKQIESIAVMPFVNESGNADVEYLSDGMTETLIGSLSQIPNLNVKARSSVFRYKGKETDARTLGKELNVQAVLNGRVVKRGDDLTLYVELVNTTTENVLWKAEYNRSMANLVSLQSEIALDVSGKLKNKLSGADEAKVAKKYTDNTEAYELYLRGRYFLNRRTQAGAEKATDFFQQALAKDPNDALAYAGLSDSYTSLIFPLGAAAPKDAMFKAKEAAMRAVAIDNSLGEAHASLAYVTFFYDWDWPAAERDFKRAIELNPNNADAHHWYSHYLMAQGRIEESLVQSKQALELSPFDLIMNVHLAWHYLYARQYDQALEQIQKTVEMDRNFAQTYPWIGLIEEQRGRHAEAIAAFQEAIRLFPGGSSVAEAELAHAYATSGKREEAQKIILKLQELAKHGYVSSYQIAAIYAGLGEKDQTFAWLEKAYEERSGDLVNLNADQRFDNLRRDQRFADLVRRVGLPK